MNNMKKMYITSGTYDYLWRLQQKHRKRGFIIMHNKDHTLLLEETEKRSIFRLPRTYEIIEERGELPKTGFAHFYYYPVSEENRSLFEHYVLKGAHQLFNNKGLVAFRFLRPVKRDSYIFLTIWEEEAYFQLWKKRQSFAEAFNIHESKLKKIPQPFPDPAYGISYTIGEKEENEETEGNL